MFDLPSRTVFLALSGSHTHGTATPASDVDVRGVCIAPMGGRLGYRERFEQFQGGLPESLLSKVQDLVPGTDAVDSVVYDVVKSVKLIAENNPNMLEMMWVPENTHIILKRPWERILEIRDKFLSKRCRHTFMGYAHAQYKKIQSHRSWLLNPPRKKPERSDFDLPEFSVISADDRDRIESAIEAIVRTWQIEDILKGAEQDVLRSKMTDFWCTTLLCSRDQLEDSLKTLAGESAGLNHSTLALLSAERRYRGALKHWNSYLHWKQERNPKRAELEAKFGFDTKHASHLLRLSRMCVEILRDHKVNVLRPDAEEILAIRRGARSFEDIEEEFRRLESEVQELVETTTLPHSPDHDTIEQVLLSVITENP